MFDFVRNAVSDRNPLRLIFHKLKAVTAAIRYGFPGKRLHVIAVTGTKGKTTTTNLITKILEESGAKVGMVSTINFKVADREWTNKSKQTTASPFELQRLLREMVKAGCQYAVLEVSSHAMTQSRTWGVNVDTAVLTNIQHDHIEYHGSFGEYMKAKGELFRQLNISRRKPKIPKVIVLNHDDANFEYFDQFIADQKYFYGFEKGIVRASNIELKPDGTRFVLHIPNGAIDVKLSLPGEVNVYNAMAAVSACLTSNLTVDSIKSALEKASQIPGRFEHVECGQKYAVIVDYAHTEDSLDQLLALYRKVAKNKLFLVFGATGGGRDKSKRPLMGKIAAKYADYIVITNDDPYEECQMDIIDQIADGMERVEGQNMWKIPHRREAIRLALTRAKEGDIVVLAGKGCEEIQIVGKAHVPWDDRKVVRELLTREVKVEIGKGKIVSRENVCLQS